MGPAIYLLSTLVTALCAVQLLLAFRRVRKRLLLWSGICFAILTLTHALTFLDLEVFPEFDLYPLRLVTTAIAFAAILYGLIWEQL